MSLEWNTLCQLGLVEFEKGHDTVAIGRGYIQMEETPRSKNGERRQKVAPEAK